jgi:hypothetical protein
MENAMTLSLRLAVASLVLALGLSGCTASWAPQVNPVPYYTFYPASLSVVTAAAEKALPQAGMRFTGSKQISPDTVEVHGYDPEGNAILITLQTKGAAVTKFSARIGLYGHLREVEEIEHWMGQYVGQAIARP